MTKKLSNDEAKLVVNESCIKHNLQVCEKFNYNGIQTNITVKCNICLYQFNRKFFSFKYDDLGCPECNEKTPYSKYNIETRIYNKRPVSESRIVLKKLPDDYKSGNKTKLNLLCLTCSHSWNSTSINSFCSKFYGCPLCNKRIRYTDDTVPIIFKSSESMNSNIIVLDSSNIENNESKINVKCSLCNHTWYKGIRHLVAGRSGCPVCAKNYKFTKDNVISRIYSEKDPNQTNIIVLEIPEEPSWNTYLNLKCTICDNCWDTTTLSSYIYNDIKCKNCTTNKSVAVLQIEELLYKNNIRFISEYRFNLCRNIKPLPFDFYLYDYNICIEYDGRQHFEIIEHWGGESSLEYTKKNDSIKTQYCIENNIRLIRISYKENHKKIIEDLVKGFNNGTI